MNEQPTEMLVGGWRRTGVILIHAIALLFGVAVLLDLVVLRGCGLTRSCGPAQDVFTVVAYLAVVAGTAVLAIRGWTGRLPGTWAAAPGSVAVLKQSSVTAVVALTLVSGGFYVPVWFLRRREALNLLDSPAKLWEWGPLALLAVQTMVLAVPEGPVTGVARVCAVILTLVLSFRTRTILGDHEHSKTTGVLLASRSEAAPSAMLTFLLNIWYLQYTINELVQERDAPPTS
jgi:hypothetical protein